MKTLKNKPFVVTDPAGNEHLVYAKTQLGAISDVQTEQRLNWTARPATGEDMYIAARDGRQILNAPASISHQPAQADMLDSVGGDDEDR